MSSSSLSRSTVSAGFRSEWTLLAMLDRRVAGAECSKPRGNFGGPNDQPLSTLRFEDPVVSFVNGGVPGPDAYCRRGAPISYCAKTSRTCWSPGFGVLLGDDGHCADALPLL